MGAKALAAALEDMTPDQVRQREFITEYLDNIKADLLRDVKKMPASWDGHEIRRLVFDQAGACVIGAMRDRRSKRYRDFEAHCLTYNLY